MQVQQKDQQIIAFRKQTMDQFDELADLQKELKDLKKVNTDQLAQKVELEIQVKTIKSENDDLQKQKEEKDSNPSTAEEYLNQMCQEKDLQSLLHFCQLVNAKYNQVYTQKYVEELSKGGPVAMGQMMPGMPPAMNSFP